MANLKATTYEELVKLHDKRDNTYLTIGHNTTSERERDFDEEGRVLFTFTIRLHGHPIVKLTADKVSFTLAGWGTVTTRERVNQFIGRNCLNQHRNVQMFNGEPIDDYTWYEIEDLHNNKKEHAYA